VGGRELEFSVRKRDVQGEKVDLSHGGKKTREDKKGLLICSLGKSRRWGRKNLTF